MLKIIKYTKKYLPFILLAPIAMVAEVILEINIPQVMAEIVDVGIPSGNNRVVVTLGIKMILMAFCSLLAGMAGCYLSSTGAMGFGSELRRGIFEKIQDFSFENIDSFQQSSLLTRLTTDVDYVQQGMRMLVTMSIRSPFMMIAAAIVAYKINKRLFVIFGVAIPVLFIAVGILAVIALPKFKYMLTRFDSLNDMAKEYLTNVRVVKAFVREKHEEKKFNDVNSELMSSSIDIEGLLVILGPIVQIVVYGCIIAVYYYGGIDIAKGNMELGSLTAFLSYIAQILTGLLMIVMIFMNLIRLKGSFDRLMEVLNTESSVKDGALLEQKVENGSIEFKNVEFSYVNALKPSLLDVNFKINSGETVGIIGSTGSGKSTLVQLIPRLYDVSKGEILVGGINVKDYSLKALRDDVSMVLQQNVLFSGTILDNLRWGNEQASLQEVREACKQAQADDFITSFPDGYQTDLGQGGVNVSGGQKQRLCIARALLKKPKIIILDDSTSAVDTHTDSQIRAALARELKETTTLIIAQRISSVMDADRVIVMDNGKVVDFDTPSNLYLHNEIYRDIYDTQMKGVE